MGKHRKMSSTAKKFAALGAAAATTTALTVAVVPDSQADKSQEELLRLLADIRPFGTDPQAIPDLTGGLGSAGYDLAQQVADQIIRLIVDNVSLQALAEAAGLTPEDLIQNLLTDVLGPLVGDSLGGALGQITVPVGSVIFSVLTDALEPVLGETLAGPVAALLAKALAGPGDPLSVSNLGDLFGALGA